MANSAFTILPLSYANTFGDWVVATNSLITENNNLAIGDFIKPTGVLYLNNPVTGLIVAYNATLGSLSSGPATFSNNATVLGQVYFSNTILGLTNTGQMNVGGIILALASNTGLAVSNNATVGGTLIVSGGAKANSLSINNDTSTNTLSANIAVSTASLSVSGTSYENIIVANTSITVPNLTVNSNFTSNGTFTINGTTVYNSNNFVISATTVVPVISYFTVYRGGGSNANAAIRWNEPGQYWDVLQANGVFLRLLTSANLNNSLTLVSDNYGATSNVANILYTLITTGTSNLTASIAASNTNLTNAINTANTFLQANDALVYAFANGAFNKANNALANTSGVVFGGNLTITGNVTAPIFVGSLSGNANTVTNGLYTTNIGTSVPSPTGTGASGNWNINANTVTNGLYTTNIGTLVPSPTGTGASGNWNINANTVTNGLYTTNIGTLVPSPTGAGASGNWNINIYGTANTAVVALGLDGGTSYGVSSLVAASIVTAGIGTNGYVSMLNGSPTNTGYLQWVGANGVRAGYLGYAPSVSTADTGTIALQCSQFNIGGAVSIGTNATIGGALTVAGSAALGNATIGGYPVVYDAGTWTINITGSALTSLGVNQTWGNYTSSRAFNTVYTNSTPKPIEVIVTFASSGNGGGIYVYLNGTLMLETGAYDSGYGSAVSFIVPIGQTYEIVPFSVGVKAYWSELR
jgi:hypothetical protein